MKNDKPQDFNEKLETLLKSDERFVNEDKNLIKSEVVNKAWKFDEILIELLISVAEFKEKFFREIKGHCIFNVTLFVDFVMDKNFLNDSYTKFGNKIGLTIGDKYLKQRGDVALVWPFKDCILEGGMSDEETKRKEIFFNEILAQDEIDRLFHPKVLTKGRRLSSNGDEQLGKIKLTRDESGLIRDNLIIKGNNLLALHSLTEQFAGKVKLIYIDPPYNTGSDGFRYNDNFNHAAWLTFMKNRLEVARELLSNDGSIYVNIDYNEVFYLKILMDEIFGENNFQREIIWRMGWLSGYKTAAKNYIRNHDTILYYTKNPDNFVFNKVYNTIKDYAARFNHDSKKEIATKLQDYGLSKDDSQEFVKYISEIGLPKQYPLEDTWNSSIYDKLNSIAVVSFSGEKVSKMLGCDEIKGQKAEKLLQRIFKVSTNEGDLILDYHLGSGTTAAVAHKMKRQYIGIEQMNYIESIAVARLKKVIAGEQSGISKDVDWQGGGEFVYFELKKYNQEFIGRIQNAKDTAALQKIWEEMKEKSFLNWNVDLKNQDEAFKEWVAMPFGEQQKSLLSLLDKNQLYVNLSEIDDEDFDCSDDEKDISKQFYGKLKK